MRTLLLIFVSLILLGRVADAQDWGNFAIISSTLGNHAARLCVGDGSRPSDLGCPTYAPSLTTAGDLSVSGTVTANKFIGDGSGLLNLSASGDRIVSGSLLALANSATGYISLTTAGTTWGYLSSATSFIPFLAANTVSSSFVSATSISVTTAFINSSTVTTVAGGGGNYIVSGSASVSTTSTNGGVISLATGSGLVMTISGSNVGIGTAIPTAKLQVGGGDGGASTPPAMISGAPNVYAGRETLILYDPTAFAAGVGSGISFGGKYNTAGNYTRYGAIEGVKENGTDGDYSGALRFFAQLNTSTPTERMTILGSTGNVGIGTTNPSLGKLQVVNSGGYAIYGSTTAASSVGVYGFSNQSGSWGIYCGSSSGGGCGGDVGYTNNSDVRLKQNILSLDDTNGLAAIERLRPVTFHWKDAGTDKAKGLQLGFIAQEVEKIFPQLVSRMPAKTITLANGTKQTITTPKGIDYAGLVVPLVKAVQELKADNDNLRRQLEQLNHKVDQINQRKPAM